MDKLIIRINELSALSRSRELSDEEKIERTELREQYLERYRISLISTLENTYVVDEVGNKKKLERKFVK